MDGATIGAMPDASPSSTGRDQVDSTRLQRMARAYADSALLWAALDLRVFTAVNAGASDVAALAAACDITELNADRLVSCLLAVDLLRKDDGGRLVNAPTSTASWCGGPTATPAPGCSSPAPTCRAG